MHRSQDARARLPARAERAAGDPEILSSRVVARALEGTGLNLVGSCSIEAYDARAPEALRSRVLMPGARGVVVIGSAGPELWRRARGADGARWEDAHPLDAFVARMLDRADAALAREGVAFRRFVPTLDASPRLSFRALGELAGLGSMGPFGMLIHAVHGPWWALRGAYLVDAEVVAEPGARADVCAGCAAPCVGGPGRVIAVGDATPEVRSRCVIGQASRYDDEQIAYHSKRRS